MSVRQPPLQVQTLWCLKKNWLLGTSAKLGIGKVKVGVGVMTKAVIMLDKQGLRQVASNHYTTV